MKKFITILLVAALVLGLCACGGSGEGKKEDGLQIGFAKENITPDFSVGLDGHSNWETRRSQSFIDYLYMTCIAAKSGEETILIYTIDILSMSNSRAESLRQVVTAATGIPGDKIFVGATHCHSAPALQTKDVDNNKYFQQFMAAAVPAAENAIADLSPATMLTTTTEIDGMNFIRHYEMNDGTYAGPNFGDWTSGIKGHASETDNRMVLVKFDRGEEKKDVLLVNWQAHPDYVTGIGETSISADFPGALRSKLGKDADMEVAYFTGASGNQNPKSEIKSENPKLKDFKAYGEKLAESAYNALPNLKPVEGEAIKTSRVMLAVDVDHTKDNMVGQAEQVMAVWNQGSAVANDLAKKLGFVTRYEARAVYNRSKLPLTQEMEMNAFSIGDVGFITGTYEMFSENAKYIRANSPFETTFVILGCSGYIPSEDAFGYNAYEAVSATHVKGTAEKLAEQYVTMLKGLK